MTQRTCCVKEILVESVTPQSQVQISLNEEVIFRAVVLRIVTWTVEGKILYSLDRKDQNAFAVVFSTTLLTIMKDELRRVKEQEAQGVVAVPQAYEYLTSTLKLDFIKPLLKVI